MASLRSNVHGAFTRSVLQAPPSAEFDQSVHHLDRSTAVGRLMKRRIMGRPSGPRRFNKVGVFLKESENTRRITVLSRPR
jgi:hypothetical protein